MQGLRVLLGWLLLLGAATAALADNQDLKRQRGPLPSRIPEREATELLIKYRSTLTAQQLDQFNSQSGAKAVDPRSAQKVLEQNLGLVAHGQVPKGWQRFQLSPGQRPVDLVPALKQNPLIELVEPNAFAYAAAPISTTYTALATFNDPLYSDGNTQWWMNRVKGDLARSRNPIFQGTGDVVVAVLDTGVNLSHPELAGRLALPGYNVLFPANPPNDDNDWIGSSFMNGHGTHVAGIIAAEANNSAAIAGLGWESRIKIMPIKVLDNLGGGTLADIATGIDWAVANGAAIINLSMETTSYSSLMETSILTAQGAGLLVVAAAGNNNNDYNVTRIYPACYSGVMAVAATNSLDQVTAYSSYSNDATAPLSCVAPGGAISDLGTGTDGGVTSTSRDGLTSAVEGTSFAAPQISALAAMLKLQVPSRTSAQIRTLIESSCQRQAAQTSVFYGAGRINAAIAIGNFKTPTPTPSITPTRTISVTSTNTPVYFTPTISVTYTQTSTITLTRTITPTASTTVTATPWRPQMGEFWAYPQPARNFMYVSCLTQGSGEAKVTLYNILGEKLLSETVLITPGNPLLRVRFDTKKVAPGIYLLNIEVQDAAGPRRQLKKVCITH